MDTTISENIKNISEAIAILVGGIWTIYRFGLNREKFPKLEFDLDLVVLGEYLNHYIVELSATVINKGLTRQYIKDFVFHLHYFEIGMPLDINDKQINEQLKFKFLFKERQWLDKKYKPFVDGGTSQKYRHITILPKTVMYAMIYSKFKDTNAGSRQLYHIEKTFIINKNAHNMSLPQNGYSE